MVCDLQVNAATTATTILVSNAILNSEFLTAAQQHIMVQKLLQKSQ
jgi:exosome complex component RRP40